MATVINTVEEARAEVNAAWQEAMKAGTYQAQHSAAIREAMGTPRYDGMMPTVKAAMKRVWAAHAALELATLRERNARLHDLYEEEVVNRLGYQTTAEQLGEELRKETFLLSEERCRTRGLMADLADVKDLSDGAKEIRALFDDLNVPAEKRGLKAMFGWLVEEITTLRQVNQSRDEAHVIPPETVELLKKISNSPGTNALWIATDKLSLATFRAWWYSHTEDERRVELYSVVGDLIAEPSKRGSAWIKITRDLAANPTAFVGPLPMGVGKTGTIDHIVQKGNNTVTVGTEQRGPEWGKGRAKKAFEDLRAHNASIPRGKRVAHELSDKSLFLPDEDLPNVG